jgi:hypothetical protein
MRPQHAFTVILLLSTLVSCQGDVNPEREGTVMPHQQTTRLLETPATSISPTTPALATALNTATFAIDNLTPTNIPTPVPSLTPTLVVSPTLDYAPLIGPVIGFRVENSERFFLLLFDVETASFREVRAETFNTAFSVRWFENGCLLDVGDHLVDLQGNAVWEFPTLNWDNLHPEGTLIGDSWMSPDRQWLAYLILSGDETYFASEISDVAVVPLSEPEGVPTFLSSHGGVQAAAWTSDSQELAYADYDDNGIMQIYVVTLNSGVTQQLTTHTDPIEMIEHLVWSPDNQVLAYSAVDDFVNNSGWVGIVSAKTQQWGRISPDDFGLPRLNEIFWSQDGNTVLIVGRGLNDSSRSTQAHWVNVETGTVQVSFYAAEAPHGEIHDMFPVTSDLDTMIFMSRNQEFYLLKIAQRETIFLNQYWPVGFALIHDMAVTPFTFPGEPVCENGE